MALSDVIRQFQLIVKVTSGETQLTLSDKEIANFEINTAASQKTKFFGIAIPQELTITILDKNKQYKFNNGDSIVFRLMQSDTSKKYDIFTKYYITEIERDAESNNLTIKASDIFASFKRRKIKEVNLVPPYTAWEVFHKVIGDMRWFTTTDIRELLEGITYPDGANLSGEESLYDILIALCELSGGYIYSLNDVINLRSLHRFNISPAISPNQYFKLSIKGKHSLHKIIVGNSLGDNIYVETANPGETEFIRDNPFFDNRTDAAEMAQRILDNIGGEVYTNFVVSWRGNALDPFSNNFAVADKEKNIYASPIFNNKITYDGGLKFESSWGYEPQENETFANPATVGERINQTTAKVDKVNKKIELVVSDVEKNNEAIQENISRIDQDSKSISASVEQVKKDLAATSDDLNGSIGELTERVNATMTQDQVKIEIEKEIAKGTDKVTTGTGFTFNEDGLTVSKKNNVMSTQITENGMYITESGNTVLSANNVGVDAKNLHATTYLIVGQNSRFEDYGNDQTGCFWIGSGFGGLKAWR